jgi:hypothetical protein
MPLDFTLTLEIEMYRNPYQESPHCVSEQFFLAAQNLQNLRVIKADKIEEMRNHRRQARTMSILLQFLDDDLQPNLEPFWAITRDISLRGMGVICNDPIEVGQCMRMALINETTTVIAEVKHCSPIGVQYPLYLVGVEYVN